MAPTLAQGVHFVGSIPMKDTQTVFQTCGSLLGPRIKRMPDGETGDRAQGPLWQRHTWGDQPHILASDQDFYEQSASASEIYQQCAFGLSDTEGRRIIDALPQANTHLDTYALESYKHFVAAKDSNHICPFTKFMVTIPTPFAVLSLNYKPELQRFLEPVYVAAVHKAIKKICDSIPRESLSIQIDIAVEFGLFEGFDQPWWASDSDSIGKTEGALDRVVDLMRLVPPDVDLGVHLCYGDFEHKHFKEPEDAYWLNFVGVEVLRRLRRQHMPREVQFIHLPVPVARDDEAYFAPLKELQSIRGGTEIYLGLVHPHDIEGTRRRIEVASRTIEPFGVATECGMGRTPCEDIDSILQTMRDVAAPWQ